MPAMVDIMNVNSESETELSEFFWTHLESFFSLPNTLLKSSVFTKPICKLKKTITSNGLIGFMRTYVALG